MQVRAVDEGGVLDISFFQSGIPQDLPSSRGRRISSTARPMVSASGGRWSIPLVEREGQQLLTGRIMPIYHLTAGLNQSTVARAVRQGLDECGDLPEDVLPDEVRRAHQLCYIGFAYENVHFPASPEALAWPGGGWCSRSCSFLSCGLSLLRARRETAAGPVCRAVDMAAFYDALPFALTGRSGGLLSSLWRI